MVWAAYQIELMYIMCCYTVSAFIECSRRWWYKLCVIVLGGFRCHYLTSHFPTEKSRDPAMCALISHGFKQVIGVF